MIFVNLVVSDLDRARGFYESLGFRVEQHSSDAQGAALIVDDKIVIKLLVRDAFAELVHGEVGDPSQSTTVVNCLSVVAREGVDELVAKAEASGATSWSNQEDPATYTKGFRDLDGHAWCVTYMEPVHVIN